MKLYILATIKRPSFMPQGEMVEEQLILDTVYTVSSRSGQKLDKHTQAVRLENELTLEKVQGFLTEQDDKATLVSFKVLPKPTARWVQGDYYAHEYDEYVAGRARLLKWTDSFVELEVECLDKSKRVMDGIWEYEQTGSGTQNNGCGDKFHPSKLLK